jgi:hypothetical protein
MSSDHLPSKELAPAFDPELLQVRWILGGLRPEDLVSQASLSFTAWFFGYGSAAAGWACESHTGRPMELS